MNLNFNLIRGVCRNPSTAEVLQSAFHLNTTAVIKNLINLFAGYSQGGHWQQIVGHVGKDVVLPCFLKTSMDSSHLQLEWTRTDLTPGFIYVWDKNKENVEFKQPSYLGRTSLSFDKLKQGDVSLTLSKVELSDLLFGRFCIFSCTLSR
uniref:Immunoglobulin V-set domain-containing protein n=1 Tax=Pundamilia nyererei TaxID=303518 RepID=A0A3B4FVU9_9CICH